MRHLWSIPQPYYVAQDAQLAVSASAWRTAVTVACQPVEPPCSNALRASISACQTPFQGSLGTGGRGTSTRTFSATPNLLSISTHSSRGYVTWIYPVLLY